MAGGFQVTDKKAMKGQAERMANVSKAAVPALWASDPGFVAVAKYLYGEDVTPEQIVADVFGKMDPGPSDVHVPGGKKTQKPPIPKNSDEKVEETKKALAQHAKIFFDTIEKAHQAGLIDDEGNFTDEIEKSRQYVRDHAGRFATTGKHTARNIAGLVGAGALAAGGAALAAKSPKTVETAASDLRYVGAHLNHPDPVTRHVARSLIPHALKSSGKALATAGTGTVASAGAVYEGTHTYQRMRNEAAHRPDTKAARLEPVSKLPLRVGAAYVNNGAKVLEHVRGYTPKHAASLTKPKKLRRLIADAGEEAVYNPTKPISGLVDMTKRDYKRDPKGRFAREGASSKDVALAGMGTYTTLAGGTLIGVGNAEMKTGKHNQNLAQQAQGDAMLRDAMDEPLTTKDRMAHGVHPSVTSWGQHADVMERRAREFGEDVKVGRNLKRGGVAATAAGVGMLGALAYEHHKKNYDEHEVTWEGDFSKVDDEKRQVFGWASVTEMDGKPVVDLQGDYIAPDEIEKAAYDYVISSRVGGDMHTRVDEFGNVIKNKPMHVSDLIESMVFTPEKCEAMGISKSLAGRWWTGFQINDPQAWLDVKEGRRTGFSIHGLGLRKSIEPEELGIEDELIDKAWDESGSPEEFAANLETLAEVTGVEKFADIAKHLAHGINMPQINPQQSRNAAVYGSMGAGAGGVAGLVVAGRKGAEIGAVGGGLTGTAVGVHAGRNVPERPPSLAHIPRAGVKAARYVSKAVDNSNRMGGAPSSRQGLYTQYALSQATQQLAPQVAQHLQALQEQQWQQQMMEQQQMEMMAQQAGQNFAVQMGPYANQPSQRSNQSNPLSPPQQPQQGNTQQAAPSAPSAPTAQQFFGS